MEYFILNDPNLSFKDVLQRHLCGEPLSEKKADKVKEEKAKVEEKKSKKSDSPKEKEKRPLKDEDKEVKKEEEEEKLEENIDCIELNRWIEHVLMVVMTEIVVEEFLILQEASLIC